ncbi:MAG TPA: hypothetical protein VNO51_09165 [Ilumatobacteraceae bacterium]|nr:hypothetical protein [Ilumatobacteraceae bacterium]
MKVRYGSIRLGARTVFHRISATPDLKRWSDLDSFDASWGSRAELIAGLIPPGSRVLEFGAGQCRLRSFLDPRCVYTPADLVDRGPGTFVVDLNRRPLPLLTEHDPEVVVFAGVLEYLVRLPELVRWLAGETPRCIASYECASTPRRSLRRLRESARRARSGWINSYREDDLVELFVRNGFECVDRRTWSTPDGDERVFVFEQPGPSGDAAR